MQLQQRCCVTDMPGVQSVGRRLSLWSRDLTCDQAAMRNPGVSFNGLQPRKPCNYTDNYSFSNPGGMEG